MSVWDPIPEAIGDEDGERWYVQGHVDPALAVLSVLVEEAVNCGPAEVHEMLVGRHPAGPERFSRDLQHAQSLFGRVRHFWAKPDPADDERMLPAIRGEAGAEPWTEFLAP